MHISPQAPFTALTHRTASQKAVSTGRPSLQFSANPESKQTQERPSFFRWLGNGIKSMLTHPLVFSISGHVVIGSVLGLVTLGTGFLALPIQIAGHMLWAYKSHSFLQRLKQKLLPKPAFYEKALAPGNVKMAEIMTRFVKYIGRQTGQTEQVDAALGQIPTNASPYKVAKTMATLSDVLLENIPQKNQSPMVRFAHSWAKNGSNLLLKMREAKLFKDLSYQLQKDLSFTILTLTGHPSSRINKIGQDLAKAFGCNEADFRKIYEDMES